MKSNDLIFIICLLITLVHALPAPSTHVVHEKRNNLHSRWIKRDRIASFKVLPVRIGLTQSNLENGYGHLMDVSDPRSPNYGKHWTPNQVIEAFRPSEATESNVRQWLISSGISEKRIRHSDDKGWLTFLASAREAERLLYTELHEYHDSITGKTMPGCESYHLPQHISPHVDYVTPGVNLIPEETRKTSDRRVKRMEPGLGRGADHLVNYYETTPPSDPNDLSTCDFTITPACIAALYKIPSPTSARPDNSLGIFESLLEFWYQPDMDKFFANFTPSIPNGTHPIAANIDGGVQSTDDPYYAGGEALLDLAIAYPIIYPQTITNFQVDDLVFQANATNYTGFFNTFLDALDASYCNLSAFGETGNHPIDPIYPDPLQGGWQGDLMCGTYTPTNVISVSYGGYERDLELSYQRRQCQEFMKLGLQGISMLFSSGDSGVSAPEGDDYNGCLGPDQRIFNPGYPASCPFITSVGGTKVYPGHSIFDAQPESAVNDLPGHPFRVKLSSGGGFSNVYSIPDYQAEAVATYFSDHDPGYPYYSALAPDTDDIFLKINVTKLAGSSGGVYNRIGRGFPDVSAIADRVALYGGGRFGHAGGTSASCPLFASIINRINEERLNAGKSTLGFLNPALYANPWMFNDIVNGSNPGCNTTGFSAVPGWDPVTGLGSPRYPDMLSYFMGLQ